MKNNIGEKMRVASIETAISLDNLTHALEDIQMNTNMHSVDKLINAKPLPPNKSKYHK